MFNRQEAALLKQRFWTSFGQYMAPVPGAEGGRVQWVNYKTGVKDIQFSMQADENAATIAIVISHADRLQRKMVFEQLLQWKPLLTTLTGEQWHWETDTDNGQSRSTSKIYQTLEGVSIFKTGDWPAIISFFKLRIMALDSFWTDVKPGFE